MVLEVQVGAPPLSIVHTRFQTSKSKNPTETQTPLSPNSRIEGLGFCSKTKPTVEDRNRGAKNTSIEHTGRLVRVELTLDSKESARQNPSLLVTGCIVLTFFLSKQLTRSSRHPNHPRESFWLSPLGQAPPKPPRTTFPSCWASSS